MQIAHTVFCTTLLAVLEYQLRTRINMSSSVSQIFIMCKKGCGALVHFACVYLWGHLFMFNISGFERRRMRACVSTCATNWFHILKQEKSEREEGKKERKEAESPPQHMCSERQQTFKQTDYLSPRLLLQLANKQTAQGHSCTRLASNSLSILCLEAGGARCSGRHVAGVIDGVRRTVAPPSFHEGAPISAWRRRRNSCQNHTTWRHERCLAGSVNIRWLL